MQQINFLSFDDVKRAVSEVLSENEQFTNNSKPEPEVYIHGLQGLADFLGIGVTTSWKLVKKGKLPYYRAGKKYYFKRSEIEAVTSNRII